MNWSSPISLTIAGQVQAQITTITIAAFLVLATSWLWQGQIKDKRGRPFPIGLLPRGVISSAALVIYLLLLSAVFYAPVVSAYLSTKLQVPDELLRQAPLAVLVFMGVLFSLSGIRHLCERAAMALQSAMVSSNKASIFINYRRDDTAAVAGRIFDRLLVDFDRDELFIDVDAIAPGQDFVKALEHRVAKCNAFVAVIGRGWAEAAEADGQLRLHDPRDYVRIELEAALARGVPVIPVLVDGAKMPKEAQLPESLKALTRRQAVELSHSRFASDAGTLTEALLHNSPAGRSKDFSGMLLAIFLAAWAVAAGPALLDQVIMGRPSGPAVKMALTVAVAVATGSLWAAQRVDTARQGSPWASALGAGLVAALTVGIIYTVSFMVDSESALLALGRYDGSAIEYSLIDYLAAIWPWWLIPFVLAAGTCTLATVPNWLWAGRSAILERLSDGIFLGSIYAASVPLAYAFHALMQTPSGKAVVKRWTEDGFASSFSESHFFVGFIIGAIVIRQVRNIAYGARERGATADDEWAVQKPSAS
jgi:TIR domain